MISEKLSFVQILTMAEKSGIVLPKTAPNPYVNLSVTIIIKTILLLLIGSPRFVFLKAISPTNW